MEYKLDLFGLTLDHFSAQYRSSKLVRNLSTVNFCENNCSCLTLITIKVTRQKTLIVTKNVDLLVTTQELKWRE